MSEGGGGASSGRAGANGALAAALTPGRGDRADAPPSFRVRGPLFEGTLGELTQALRSGAVPPERLDLLGVVRDFLDYFERIADRDLEGASEALPALAQVVELKLRLLLPRAPREDGEEDEPGEELHEALHAVALLEAMEDAIRFLRARRHERRVVLPARTPRPELPRPRRPHRVGVGRLAELAARARPGGYFEMTVERLTLAGALRALARKLRAVGRGWLHRLHPAAGWADRTVVFAAMLELVREGRAEAHQEETYGPIELRAKGR